MSRRQRVSHDDIQRALSSFRQSGGVIRKLPDQVQPNQAGLAAKLAEWEQEMGPLVGGDEPGEMTAPGVRF